MSLADLLHDPLFRSIVIVIWLLPCAIQDRRTRHVSNWLTVPVFIIAWPASLMLGNFPLTLATFVGVYVAFRWSGDGFGPADGKIAVGLAGIAPLVLFAGMAVQMLAFAIYRLQGEREPHLPGAVGFYLGAVIMVSVLTGQWIYTS
jgi:hypothetical protein